MNYMPSTMSYPSIVSFANQEKGVDFERRVEFAWLCRALVEVREL